MRQPFDDSTTTFYRHFFERQGLRAIPQFVVFSRGRAIDLVVECREMDQLILAQTVFAHFRRLNSVEFKGPNDPLSPADLNRIMMRAWGLGAIDQATKKKIAKQTWLTESELSKIPSQLSQRTVTIICVNHPRNVIDTLRDEFQFAPTEHSGVYLSTIFGFPVRIIHPAELSVEPRNYPLLPLSRGDKLTQFLEVCLAEGLVEYLRLILDIGQITEPDVIWRRIMEVMNMAITIREDTWPYIDTFFREMPEAFEKIPTLREVLDDAQRLAKREGKQEGKREGQREGKLEGQRQTLIRLLKRKFGTVPDGVVQTIQRTNSEQMLTNWLDQVIFASSLDEFNFEKT